MAKKSALVISAHAADFVWRCGGAIALHQKLGYEVTIVCLSFGERGESGTYGNVESLWRKSRLFVVVKRKRLHLHWRRMISSFMTLVTTLWSLIRM